MRVLITGANRGIGRALLDSYRADGHDAIGTSRGSVEGPGWVTLDVTAPDAGERFHQALGDTPLDLLVCNAGVYLDQGQSLASGYPAQMWADTFATNVTGVFQTIQAALPALKQARGKIAIISSQMGSDTLAPGGSYIYRASKAAVLNLGRNLATDLAAQGIAVGIYHPGWVRTDMGGGSADIGVEDAVRGLRDRFKALSVSSTGVFETWDGRAHPY